MPPTMVHRLKVAAESGPDKLAFRYLVDGDELAQELTYCELVGQAAALAQTLSCYSERGDRVVLMFSAGLESVVALYACFMAGVVAVPTPAPHVGRIKSQSIRLVGVVADCSPAIILTTKELCDVCDAFSALWWELATPKWLAVDISGPAKEAPALDVAADELALLQYTSGSTSKPRGVMLTHANIVANQRVVREIASLAKQTNMMSWSPFYHDMGLGFYLHPVHEGVSCTLMSPTHFMQRPRRWLQALSRYRCTASAAPNFALDRVADQISAQDRSTLDLSRLRALLVGAEPVRARTLQRFCDATAPLGFRPEYLFPCYGMAESTVMCTSGPRGAPKIARFRTASLAPGAPTVAADDEAGTTALVGNGMTGKGHELAIVSRSGAMAVDGEVGEIWLRGPSVGKGYWNRDADSERTFNARLDARPGVAYLRTGDLGFVHDGELFICGRKKDLIIVRGRNIYPEDVEEAARSASPDVGEGMAAFEGEDQCLVILAEARSRRPQCTEAIARRIREAVGSALEVEVSDVVLVVPLSLPRTSSGKIRRQQARLAYVQGELHRFATPRGEPVEAL